MAAASAARFGVEAHPLPPLVPKVLEPPGSDTVIPEADNLIQRLREVVRDARVRCATPIPDNPSLVEFVRSVTGRSPADGTIETKQIYDLLETALNQEIAADGTVMMRDPDVSKYIGNLRPIPLVVQNKLPNISGVAIQNTVAGS